MKKFIATVAGAAIALSVFAPIAGAVPANSPTRPIPLGHYATFQGWRITVLGFHLDTNASDSSSPSGAIPKGTLDEVYTIRATNVSKSASDLMFMAPDLLGSDHVAYDLTSGVGCAWGGNNQNLDTTVYPSGTIIDEECITVPSTDHRLVLGFPSTEFEPANVWFATSKSES
jgi:hypothetical protein